MSSYDFFNDFKTFEHRIRQLFTNLPVLTPNNATLRLLMSSVLVAISGAFRVHLASLLLYTNSSMITCLAGGLIIYSVYTLDRSLDSEEDIVNRKELSGSKKEIGIAASVISFLAGSYIFLEEGILGLAFLPFVTGFLYSKGIKLGKRVLKLKGGLGVKNLVVGLSWGAFIAGISAQYCTHVYAPVLVFLLYGVKTFVNSAIDDFKDIKGDTLVGLKTLPVYFGEQKTCNFLLGLHLLSHLILGIALIKGVIAFEPLIIAVSFLCGLICIMRYTNEEKYMSGKLGLSFFKDGESALIFGLLFIKNAPLFI